MTLAGVHLVRFNEAPALLPGKATLMATEKGVQLGLQ